jgi:tRNA pseudouridine55 synthase
MPEDRGFLLIDKPAGISSFDVIRALRRISLIRRIGHCGTLDPFATGLLICALGKYTRLITLLESLPKTYSATVKLGEQSSTGDTEGEITASGDIPPLDIDMHVLVRSALSLNELPVPAHSAVKISGKRAYSLARQGLAPVMPSRAVRVYTFNVISWEPPYLAYTSTVSKGTYIRSLSQWIAEQLGTVGYTVALRRLAIGDVSVENATPLDQLGSEGIHRRFISPSELFRHLEAVHAEPAMIQALHAGKAISSLGKDSDRVVVYSPEGDIVCLASRSSNELKPVVNIV